MVSGKFYWSDTISFVVGEYLAAELNTNEPNHFLLNSPYPNPFNPSTTIRFNIGVGDTKTRPLTLTIYDITGRVVATLNNGILDAGLHEIEWNASDHASGIYFVEMIAEDFRQIKKIILLK